MNKLKRFLNRIKFLKVFFSPFKRPKIKWYFGEVSVGVPYFLPRRWVKPSKERLDDIIKKEIKEFKERNKAIPKLTFVPTYEQLYRSKSNSKVSVPKKIGFDFVSLGYKTKWSNTDYRFEWSPLLSFVFFKCQIVVSLNVPTEYVDSYWESWLYYENDTDKSKTKKERIEQCKKEFSQTYTISDGNSETQKDYYDLILKEKYK